MKMAQLGEVVRPVQSWNPRSRPNEPIAYVDLSAVDNQTKAIIAPTSVLGCDAPSRARQRLNAGDILVSTVRPNLNSVATVPSNLDGATASTGFTVLRPDAGRVEGRYLFHWVQAPQFVADLVRKATGASYPAVSDRIVKESKIPLPALDEQRRIASILDQADAIRAKRRQVLAHLDALTQSIFHELLAQGPFRTVRLGAIARFIGGASLPEGMPYRGEGHGTLLMKVSDMNRGGNEREILTTALWTDAPVPRASVAPSDSVVLPKRGASIATNKKRITTRPTSLDPNLMAVHPDPRVLTPAYTFAWFQAFDLASITSGSTVPQLNKQDLAPLMIPLPELDQQHAFSEKLSAVVRQAEVVRLGGQRLDSLFASLQSRAFRGEL